MIHNLKEIRKMLLAERLGTAKIELHVWVAFQMICEKTSESPQNAMYSVIFMISLEIQVFDFEEIWSKMRWTNELETKKDHNSKNTSGVARVLQESFGIKLIAQIVFAYQVHKKNTDFRFF